MKKYSCFEAMYMSFYSRDLYRDVAKNWGAGVVLYLFILLFICCASMMFVYQPMINVAFKQLVDKIGPQVPPMSISNGVLSTPENRPYVITDPDTHQVTAIIDTSGKYTNMNTVPSGTMILITRDTTYYLDDSTLKVNKIPSNITVDIKPAQIEKVGVNVVHWTWVFFLPALVLGAFIYRLLQSLIYAAFGKFFAALSNVQLNYNEVLKISMIAVTPAIVLSTVLGWFHIEFPFEWVVYFVISMVYLNFGIAANRVGS